MDRRLIAFLLFWLVSNVTAAYGQPRAPAVEAAKPALLFSAPEIDSGFRELYQLRFSEGRDKFAVWQEKHPEDPLGDVSIAASYLFEEFYRQGVLSSSFFLNDAVSGRIDVDRSSSHHQSHTEIASDNPCSRHLSELHVRLRRQSRLQYTESLINVVTDTVTKPSSWSA
jgi:hypothetical protein